MKSLLYCPNSEKLSTLSQKVDAQSAFIIQNNLISSLSCFKDGVFEKIILYIPNTEEIDQNLCHSLYSVLKPDGTVIISHEYQTNSAQSLYDKLVIGGFKHEETNDQNTLIVKKPGWAGKGVASLKKKTVESNNKESVKVEDSLNNNAKKPNPFAKVVISNDNAELVDEDNLLSGENEYKKLEKPEDCSTKPKACKNCSCGRAEQE
jgi:hypothetical protein